jgi:hypothetical protein
VKGCLFNEPPLWSNFMHRNIKIPPYFKRIEDFMLRRNI